MKSKTGIKWLLIPVSIYLIMAGCLYGVVYVDPAGTHVPPFDSWATAATNLTDAVSACESGGVVEVGAGLYPLTADLQLTQAVHLVGVEGAEQTILDGGVVQIHDAGVVMEGFTVQYAPGRGICFYADGLVQHCLIQYNMEGGVRFDGVGALVNSVVYSNRSCHEIGGIYMNQGGAAINCLIHGNYGSNAYGYVQRGSGACINSNGLLQNCTIVGNNAGTYRSNNRFYPREGGGVYCEDGGTIINCIVWDNGSSSWDDYSSGTLCTYPVANPDWEFVGANPMVYNCCSSVLMPGVNNLVGNPEMISSMTPDGRLLPFSPCIDAGYEPLLYDVFRDLAGYPRRHGAGVNIGAYEADELVVQIAERYVESPAPCECVFTAEVYGACLDGVLVEWDFNGDGEIDKYGLNALVVTNIYDTAGTFDVACHVQNISNQVYSTIVSNMVRICASPVQYVSLTGGHVPPFSTWPTAATNIQAALDLAAGSTVILADGEYELQQTLLITNQLSLTSANGAEHSAISGNTQTQCVFAVGPGVVIDDLTIKNGFSEVCGAGLACEDEVAIRNCIIVSNRIDAFDGFVRGGGLYAINGCEIQDCLIGWNSIGVGNDRSMGGGCYIAHDGVVTNCVFIHNWGGATYRYMGQAESFSYGGGLAAISNVLITGCHFESNVLSAYTYSRGAGVYLDNGRIEHSILCRNEAQAHFYTTYPPMYYYRYHAPGYGGGAYLANGAELVDCVVTGNQGTVGGGLLVDNASVMNAVVSDNESFGVYEPWHTVIGYGGGVQALNTSRVSHCRIDRNTAADGGGVMMDGCSKIQNCQVSCNQARTGGGIYIASGGGEVRLCTVANNSVSSNGVQAGSGIICHGPALVANSIVYDNQDEGNAGDEICDTAGELQLVNCCYESSTVIGTGCFTNEPQFIQARQDDNQLFFYIDE